MNDLDDHITNIRKTAKGLLPLHVYKKLHDVTSTAMTGDIVEVGTAHGAATIVMASAKLKHDPTTRIYTFDRLEGGSRSQYGSIEDNKRIIEENFKTFDVDKSISLLVGDVDEKAKEIPDDIAISVLMLDADGAIDRDFGHFYNKVIPGGIIIIDDYSTVTYLSRHPDGILVDQKHKLTHGLVNYYKYFGLLKDDQMVGDTLFAIKPKSFTEPFDFSKADVLPIYRSLTFTTGKMDWPGAILMGRLLQNFPSVHAFLKKIYVTHLRPSRQ